MTIPELPDAPRPGRKAAVDWTELERGLAVTLPALGQAHLVLSTRAGNRFVQFASDPVNGLRAETVGNAYLEPADRHTDTQMEELLELGWNEPTHAPGATGDERVANGSPNYFRDWAPRLVRWDDVARLAVRTLRAIGVAEPAALEYAAWDAQDRKLSLPALRLTARKARAKAPPARRVPGSPRAAPEANEVPPAVRDAKAKLLSAVRVFSADNSLQYDEDGELPMRIGASPGWARLVEQPLLVKLHCLVAPGVEVTEALLRRIHEINGEWFMARLILAGRNVFAAVDFAADPFCVEHFTSCCSALLAMEHEHGQELRSKVEARS